MTSTEPKPNAQQVRDDFQARRLKRLAQTPQQTEVGDPQLPPNLIVDPADGTLNKDALTTDLVVGVLRWEGLPPTPAFKSTLQLLWGKALNDVEPPPENYQVIQTLEVPGPPDSITFPVPLTLPKASLAPDGKYFLKTGLKTHSSGSFIYSNAIQLITDSEAPYVHQAPAAMLLPAVPITDDYLTSNGDKVIAEIPEYPDYQPGDRVAFYWGALPPPEKPEDVIPVGVIDVDATTWPFKVEYSGDSIRAAGDGGCYALYVLIDKATNPSRLSIFTPAGVALGPLPTGLQDPNVPLAADGLVDLEDAVAGVLVEIPAFNDYKQNDRIKVTWGTTELTPLYVPSVPDFPLWARVPPVVLQSTYGKATGSQATPVSYFVERGTVPSEIRSISVDVDFSVPGPDRPDPDPDWPDPINPKLLPARVYGKTSNTLNVLDRTDEGEDAKLTFTLYDPLVAGQTISFWWNGAEIVEAEYEVVGTDSAGDEREIVVPWKYILEAFNNPQLPVWYKVGAPDAANQQKSQVTLVNADAVTLQPAAPVYQDLYLDQFLNCDSLYEVPGTPGPKEPAVRVQVPDLTVAPYLLKDGAEITMKWVLLSGYSGEAVIPGAELEEQITLGADYPATGFVWRVQPYDQHLLPAYNPPDEPDGRGRATYAFMFNGETVTSLPVEAYVAMYNAAGTCPI